MKEKEDLCKVLYENTITLAECCPIETVAGFTLQSNLLAFAKMLKSSTEAVGFGRIEDKSETDQLYTLRDVGGSLITHEGEYYFDVLMRRFPVSVDLIREVFRSRSQVTIKDFLIGNALITPVNAMAGVLFFARRIGAGRWRVVLSVQGVPAEAKSFEVQDELFQLLFAEVQTGATETHTASDKLQMLESGLTMHPAIKEIREVSDSIKCLDLDPGESMSSGNWGSEGIDEVPPEVNSPLVFNADELFLQISRLYQSAKIAADALDSSYIRGVINAHDDALVLCGLVGRKLTEGEHFDFINKLEDLLIYVPREFFMSCGGFKIINLVDSMCREWLTKAISTEVKWILALRGGTNR